ncbi:hypothetical protein M1439_03315 [Candidatus Marsarchaeota archaeon]|jgi:hypothetical protein|nr:hypothetical protein [Candidatus Marsarchaeota archaeon]MCL5092832.1 hypothetical protein [Candidatus Marsarchaeota archaeon]
MKYLKGIIVNFEMVIALIIFFSSFSVFEYGYITDSHLVYLKAAQMGNDIYNNFIVQEFVYNSGYSFTNTAVLGNDSQYALNLYPIAVQQCCNLYRAFALNGKIYILSVNNDETSNSN